MAATAALAAHHGRANQLPSCRPAAQCPSRPDARGPGQKLERTCRRTCVCGRAAVGGAAPVGSVADMGELQAWVARFPASQQACALTPVRSASGGWGLRADGPVSAGEQLVCVPRAAMMTVDTATESPHSGGLVDRAGLGQWQAMCLHLLTERAAGDGSRWAPYLRCLPDLSDHPLLWGPDRRAWLRGSPMLARLEARLQNVREDAAELVGAGANELPVARGVEGGLVTEESMRWAAAVLLSRAFYLAFDDDAGAERTSGAVDVTMPLDRYGPGAVDVGAVLDDEAEAAGEEYMSSLDGEPLHSIALVPWADLLNHSSSATEEALLRFDPETQTAALHAHRAYAAGDEVHDSYGPWRSASDLLLDYGFVDADNRNDWVEVPLVRLARPQANEARAFFAAAGGMLDELGAVFDAESAPDANILAWVRAAVATDEELASLGWDGTGDDADQLASALTLTGNLARPVSRSNEARMAASLGAALEEVERGYASRLEDDEDELRSLEGEGRGTGPRVSTLRALVAEKRAIRATLERVQAAEERLAQKVRLQDVWD